VQVGRSLVGAFGLGFAALALSPAAAWAVEPPLEAPTIASINPNEGGSSGTPKVVVTGTGFEGQFRVTVVFGRRLECKMPVSPPLEKKPCQVISNTQLEFPAARHEAGKVLVQVCKTNLTEEACSSSTREPSNTFTVLPEVYKNEGAIGANQVPTTGYGDILLNSPQITSQIECENIGFGSAWNAAPTEKTGPISGHGQILVWWASGHTPKALHTELSTRCRFVYHGTEENQPTSPVAWATAEPRLHEVLQEAEFCIALVQKPSECPAATEREGPITVIREVNREGLSLPWNIQFTERSERPRVQIGLPLKCKPSERTELTEGPQELERCPEASEREVSKSPARCNIPPTPAPPGCVKVQMLSNPPLNIHMEYEGYLEPLVINSGPNGLSPSSWEFEGTEKGEPTLHLRETPTTEGSTTGNVKILGFSGQELMTAK
jgi:hypothetical protein